MLPARSTGRDASRSVVTLCCAVIFSKRPACCDPRAEMVGAQSLGHPACEAKRAAQSQGCRRSKACCHSAPNVDRRDRVQLVDEEGRRVTRNKEITEFPHGREKTSLPGRWRW